MEATRAANRQRVLLGHLRQVGTSVDPARARSEGTGPEKKRKKRMPSFFDVDVDALQPLSPRRTHGRPALFSFSQL